MPTQYIRNSRKSRVPRDKEAITNSGALQPGSNLEGGKKTQTFGDVTQINPAQP